MLRDRGPTDNQSRSDTAAVQCPLDSPLPLIDNAQPCSPYTRAWPGCFLAIQHRPCFRLCGFPACPSRPCSGAAPAFCVAPLSPFRLRFTPLVLFRFGFRLTSGKFSGHDPYLQFRLCLCLTALWPFAANFFLRWGLSAGLCFLPVQTVRFTPLFPMQLKNRFRPLGCSCLSLPPRSAIVRNIYF